MRLAIADPPYPPMLGERYDLAGGRARTYSRSRARRWYGDGAKSEGDRAGDNHPDAADWDDPARHRTLVTQLLDEYDGWALATTPDGLAVYHPLPIPCRVMAWVKPNSIPGGHRIKSTWEAVILYPPRTRRIRRGGQVPDTLVASPPLSGFVGAKPDAWTRWVLDALGHNPETDTVADLFPGSGAVSRVVGG